MLRRLITAAVLCCCLLPATAAASYQDVLKDCEVNGRMTKRYTQKEYRDALAKMPTDLDEYYGCRDIIKRAQVNASSNGNDGSASPGSGGGDGGGAGGQPSAPTPEETTRASEDIQAARRGVSKVALVDVRPGALAYRDFGSVSKLPTPLIVLGALLIVGAIGVCAYLLKGRVRARGAGA
jgi:hypothetical protein